MGFLKIVKPEIHPPCPTPFITRSFSSGLPDFGVGTTWECDKCGRTYELVGIPARGARGKWALIEDS